MASNKLSVIKFKSMKSIRWNKIIDKVISTDSEDVRCIVNEQSDDYIGGYFLFSSLYNQTVYNIEENKFESIPTTKQNIIKFDIFVLTGRMLLWGNKKAADIFVTTLEQASDNKLIIEYSITDFKLMIKKIYNTNNIAFSKMKITNVLIDEGIVANCNVNLASLDNPKSIVEKYTESISQITIIISKDINPVSVTLYSSGSILVFKDRNAIDDETLNIIHDMVGGEH